MTEPTLGERMKRYERQTRVELPKRTYTLVRVDGKAFHTFTRGMERPYDERLAHAMNVAAMRLLEGMQGARLAYAQSDEISVLLTDFEAHSTEPWMGGVLQKVVSLSASIATEAFNGALPSLYRGRGTALFDSRAWTIADPNEVANYFVWRQRDAEKNSVTMAAEVVASHRELNGLTTAQRRDLCEERGAMWEDLPDGFKRGRVAYREPWFKKGPDGEETLRHRTVVNPAPRFTAGPGWLVDRCIPRPPSHPGDAL